MHESAAPASGAVALCECFEADASGDRGDERRDGGTLEEATTRWLRGQGGLLSSLGHDDLLSRIGTRCPTSEDRHAA